MKKREKDFPAIAQINIVAYVGTYQYYAFQFGCYRIKMEMETTPQ